MSTPFTPDILDAQKALAEAEVLAGPEDASLVPLIMTPELSQLIPQAPEVQAAQKALTAAEASVGQDDLSLVPLLCQLASAYNDQYLPPLAYSLLRRALTIQEKHLGSGHLDLLLTMQRLLECYLGEIDLPILFPDRDDIEKRAGDLWKDQIKKRESTDNPDVQSKISLLMDKHFHLEQYGWELPSDSHVDYGKEIGAIRDAHYAPDDIRHAELRLAFWIEEEFDPEQLTAILAMLNAHYGADEKALLPHLECLLIAAGCTEDYSDIEWDTLQRIVEIKSRVFGPKHPSVADSLLSELAYISNPEDRQNILQRVLDIRLQHYGHDNLLVSDVYMSLGHLAQEGHQFEDAQDFYEEAFDIKEMFLPASRKSYDLALKSISSPPKNWDTKQHLALREAINLRALKTLARVFGPEDPSTVAACEHLIECQRQKQSLAVISGEDAVERPNNDDMDDIF